MTTQGKPRAARQLAQPQWLILIAALVVMQFVLWQVTAFAQTPRAPEISNVKILSPRVARFEKFEMEFDVATAATHLSLPYDAAPPPGLRAGMGVSVDALFSNDAWQTTITQPAFWYQPFTHQIARDLDHWTPNGAPRWRVRFAPRAIGDWQVRLRVRDAGGEIIYPADGALDFQVQAADGGRYQGLRENPYTQRGFIRVSKSDPRYFEFEDGTPFLGVGYNAGSPNVERVGARYRDWQLNGLQFARVWLSGAGINASHWTPWTFPSQPTNNGLPNVLLDTEQRFQDADFSQRLDTKNPCLFLDFWQNGIPVQPNTPYVVTARVKLMNVTPNAEASDAGFALYREGWIGPSCDGIQSSPLTAPRVGTTDWDTVTANFTTGANQDFLNYLFFALRNVQEGRVYIDAVQLYARDDPARVNLLRHGAADSHLYFDAMNAARWDLLIEQAAQHGVYLKVVTDEKNEWIRNVIQRDGTRGAYTNNNFYAAPNTKVRWLHQAWWRYMIARWGYSTAIHSFEFVNEGDPYNGNHYDATNEMARFFDAHDPSQHLVTTSFWHSFPNREFWSDPRYQDVDYADLHAYITTGWGENASFVPPGNLETRPAHQFQGKNSFRIPATQTIRRTIHPRGIVLQEPGEWTIRYWMKQENFQARCSGNSQGSNVRVFWRISDQQSGVVPANQRGQDSLCTSPAGSFDWREFSSATDREGRALPLERRLIIAENQRAEVALGVSNSGGIAGTAWIANVELISPSGVRTPIIGEFDNTPFEKDTAWLSAAYSQLWGASSPVGARKPLVRGETGVNNSQFPNGLPTLNQDREGIWLHNFVWGQINSGGMYDLWWWGAENIQDNPKTGRVGDLYKVFLPYANFISQAPLNNGAYREAQAITSHPQLRAWGQRDDTNGRAHLWIQNRAHDWQSVVEGKTIAPLNGTVRLEKMPRGTYRVEWWDTYRARDAIFKTQVVNVENVLELQLPIELDKDVAVQITRIHPAP